jgi:hydrogenase nickel incorporation protein HypA/HybF
MTLHELAICESILGQALAVAASHGAREIGKITLRIGPLAGVEPDLLRLAFPLVAAGTRCEEAELAIETIEVSVACRVCGAVSNVRPNRLLCAGCGGWRVALLSGDEMLLDSIELREPRRQELADV